MINKVKAGRKLATALLKALKLSAKDPDSIDGLATALEVDCDFPGMTYDAWADVDAEASRLLVRALKGVKIDAP